MRAAQKLLGAQNIGGGSAWAGGVGGGSQRSQIRPYSAWNVRKQQKTAVLFTLQLVNPQKRRFLLIIT